MNKANQTAEKPEAKFKVGAVRASIWKWTNTAKDGRQFTQRKAVLDRAYKDANGQWQHTNSYDTNDVPKAVLAMQKAFEYMTTKNGESDTAEEEVQ